MMQLSPITRDSELPFVPFSIDRIIEEVQREKFPELTCRVDWQFCRMKPLASIRRPVGANGAFISFHSLLNHPQTPVEVIRGIVVHELLHLVIPDGEVKGRVEMHTAEFWEAERRVWPEMGKVNWWVECSFGEALGNGPKGTGMIVKNGVVRRERLLCGERMKF